MRPNCSVPGCDNAIKSKGLCDRHKRDPVIVQQVIDSGKFDSYGFYWILRENRSHQYLVAFVKPRDMDKEWIEECHGPYAGGLEEARDAKARFQRQALDPLQ